MQAYIYCSYKFSPVGFQIGVIDTAQKSEGYYIPKNPEGNALDNFVAKAFEQGFIKKVYGKEFGGKYIFLVKKLQQNNVEDANEGTIDIYMNFVFVFDSEKDFTAFSIGFNNLDNAAEICAQFIIPDRKIETFALKIDAEKFDTFIAEMLKNSGETADNKLYIEVISSQPQENKLKEIFKRDFSRKGESKIYFYPAVKKSVPAETSQKKTSTIEQISQKYYQLARGLQ